MNTSIVVPNLSILAVSDGVLEFVYDVHPDVLVVNALWYAQEKNPPF